MRLVTIPNHSYQRFHLFSIDLKYHLLIYTKFLLLFCSVQISLFIPDHHIIWSRKWQPTPVFLPGKFHWQRSLVGYSPWGCRVRHKSMHTHTRIFWVSPNSSIKIHVQGNSFYTLWLFLPSWTLAANSSGSWARGYIGVQFEKHGKDSWFHLSF